jgi:hypothetical protein
MAVAVLLIPCIGCGSSSNNSNPGHLTQTQASQLGAETFADALAALNYAEEAGLVSVPPNSGHQSNPMADLLKNKHISSALTPDTTIGPSTYNCTYGGTITVTGSGGGGSVNVTITPANCDDGTLTINGNPNITISGHGNDNGTTTTASISIKGDVSFVPDAGVTFPSSSCGAGINVSASITDSTGDLATCSISGEMCGQSVSGS